MRIASYLAVGLLVFSAALSAAQCEDSYTRVTLQCDDNAGCHDLVTFDHPNEGFTNAYSISVIDCCGQLFTDTTVTGPCDADMVQPAIRKEVARLAAMSDVLVADCRGHYVPYDSAANIVHSRARLDDLMKR
jgi:hypothetical protein